MNKFEYPKILLISDASWRDDNNIGNTFTSLFEGWPKDKIAMVYARPTLPSTEACDNFFQISESRMIKNILGKNIPIGQIVKNEYSYDYDINQEDELGTYSGARLYKGFHRVRLTIFLVLRELLWKFCKWEDENLDKFVDDFNPDVILSLASDSIYMNDIQKYVHQRSNSRHLLYFVDDIYSATKATISPIYWGFKIAKRKSIRKTVDISDHTFTISNEMKHEYDRKLGIDSFLLTKLSNFKDIPKEAEFVDDKINLIYAGNLYAGRLKVLIELGSVLRELDKYGINSKLTIYSASQISNKESKVIQANNWINFEGKIPYSSVSEKLSASDIVVHVESFEINHKLETKLSFSTKLVDYFKVGRCIVAIGWEEASSIKYIEKTQSGLSITSNKDMFSKLRDLLTDKIIINQFGRNSFNIGSTYHDINTKRNEFYDVVRGLKK